MIGNVVGRYGHGFAPEDGKRNKLTVKVKAPAEGGRERNLVVRARQGYVAGRERQQGVGAEARGPRGAGQEAAKGG